MASILLPDLPERPTERLGEGHIAVRFDDMTEGRPEHRFWTWAVTLDGVRVERDVDEVFAGNPGWVYRLHRSGASVQWRRESGEVRVWKETLGDQVDQALREGRL